MEFINIFPVYALRALAKRYVVSTTDGHPTNGLRFTGRRPVIRVRYKSDFVANAIPICWMDIPTIPWRKRRLRGGEASKEHRTTVIITEGNIITGGRRFVRIGQSVKRRANVESSREFVKRVKTRIGRKTTVPNGSLLIAVNDDVRFPTKRRPKNNFSSPYGNYSRRPSVRPVETRRRTCPERLRGKSVRAYDGGCVVEAICSAAGVRAI